MKWQLCQLQQFWKTSNNCKCVIYFQPERHVITDVYFLVSVANVLFVAVTTNLKPGPIVVKLNECKHSPYWKIIFLIWIINWKEHRERYCTKSSGSSGRVWVGWGGGEWLSRNMKSMRRVFDGHHFMTYFYMAKGHGPLAPPPPTDPLLE